MNVQHSILLPSNTEIIKSRDFGKVKGSLTRNQRVAFAAFIKTAYTQLLESHDRRRFSLPTNRLCEEMGINNHDLFATDDRKDTLEDYLKQLQTKTLEWRYKDEKGRKTVESSTMLSGFKMNKDTIEFSFSPWLEERILCYGNAYIMQMPTLAKLRSGYAVALYEQIQQRKDFTKWEVSLDEFRELMGIEPTQYPQIKDLKKRVLDPAIKEINEKTSLFVAYEQKKEGRTITGFLFSWTEPTKPKEKENPKQASLFDTPKNFIGHRILITDGDGVDHKLTILGFSQLDGYFVIDVEGGQVKTRATSDVELTILLREKIIKE